MTVESATSRDDFPKPIKTALALRANYQCSLASCRLPTSGPSDESPERFVNVGVAAHIAAASPGGARYDANMTSSERMDITNGIWLCQTHSKLVDADRAAYPAERLHQIKVEHEDFIRRLITGEEARRGSDFIALGHDLVFTGELTNCDQSTWTFRLDHFVIGDLNTLIAFSERFEATQPYDLFILDNMLGEGRQLATPPAWRRTSHGYEVSVQVLPSFPRVQAHELPSTLLVDDVNDIAVVNGSFARIRGLEALPQTIQQCLSTIRGEVFYDSSVGTRIHEYSNVFYDSPWLPKLIKLETIRMACIPRDSSGGQTPQTPLWAVTRVHSVVRLERQETNNWVPFRFVLQVEGIGPWEREIRLFIPGPTKRRAERFDQ